MLTASQPLQVTVGSPDWAYGDVTLDFSAIGPLAGSTRWIDVQLNGALIGRVYDDADTTGCTLPQSDQFFITADTYNTLVNLGDATFTLTANAGVCLAGTWVQFTLNYVNEAPFEDLNGNGKRDTCELAHGDINLDGAVGIDDFLTILADWGPCPAPPASCPTDLDADGDTGIVDFLTVLANWGS